MLKFWIMYSMFTQLLGRVMNYWEWMEDQSSTSGNALRSVQLREEESIPGDGTFRNYDGEDSI